jgi:iron(III) transport system ATP-binding protein
MPMVLELQAPRPTAEPPTQREPDARDVALQLHGITKRFGPTVALQPTDLTIADGELLAILGPSGCGKTTLLRVIAGLEKPDVGRVLHFGQDITRRSAAERGFGIVFQSYALFPNLTVAANVAYGLRGPRAEKRKRVRMMLELVGLPGLEKRYPSQLSGGQQQRVALARALAPRPNMLLLDEPLSALDARVRARLRVELRALQRRLGLPTVLVTHDQEEALTMADRVVVLSEGRVVQSGTPRELYRHPNCTFIGDFLGTMNLSSNWRRGENGVLFRPPFELHGLHLPDRAELLTLGIRPENLAVDHATQRDAPGHRIEATLSGLEFRGGFDRLIVDVPVIGSADERWLVDVQRSELTAEDMGMPLVLRVDPSTVHVFAESRSSAREAS